MVTEVIDGLVTIYKDHFSKFSIIWPQKKKCAEETIECLERFVFAYLGVPKLLQSDNGKEFNNHVSDFSYSYA